MIDQIISSIWDFISSCLIAVFPEKYRNRPRYKRYLVWFSFFFWRITKSRKKISVFDIPIIINNYNRLSFLKELIVSLEKRGYSNIHIIDNYSSFPPLLEYYKTIKYPIYFLDKNVGYEALWKTGLYKQFWTSFYVYTDSDVVLDHNCPNDFMSKLLDLHFKYKTAQKIGLGIHIDDLPSSYKLKEKVIQHEKEFWIKPIEPNVFVAPVDTTFALYKPFGGGIADGGQFVLRTGDPLMIHHMPWYIDSENLDDEELYYVNSTQKSTHWTHQLSTNTIRKQNL